MYSYSRLQSNCLHILYLFQRFLFMRNSMKMRLNGDATSPKNWHKMLNEVNLFELSNRIVAQRNFFARTTDHVLFFLRKKIMWNRRSFSTTFVAFVVVSYLVWKLCKKVKTPPFDFTKLGKNFVKASFSLKKLLNSWFDEIF